MSQVTLVNGLTRVGTGMFYMVDVNNNAVPTSLGSIIIPSTITAIG